MYRVLGIGFDLSEQDILRKNWRDSGAIIDFSKSVINAKTLLDDHTYTWALFHCRTLDCLPYIDIMRSIKSIPILVLSLECITAKIPQIITECTFCETSVVNQGLPHSVTCGDLFFCHEQHIVRIRNRDIDLTAKEFELFALLISNPNRVFTYEMIMEIVWNEIYDSYSRKTITNHISNIRKKLKISPDIPDFIKSIHSVGYKFDADIV